jgi:DNA-binding transcriptional LysR family regulator
MDFDLRLLQHARALAEEGSFARASRTLHLTQPALSRSIQELERRIGIKLFDRNQGRVAPTDLGRMFLARARELLGRAEALDREVATMRGSGTGSLVVGSGTFPTAIFMGAAMSAFLGKNPDVGIRLVNDDWAMLVAALRRREVDFIAAAPPPPEESSGLVSQPLSFVQGYFLVRPGHPLLARHDVGLADIVAYPIVCTGRLTVPLAALLLAARTERDRGRSMPDVACESHEMMRHIVRATDHVLLSSLAANAQAVDRGELVPLPVVDPRIGVTFAIIRLEARTLPPVADELIREVIAADRAAFTVANKLAARLPERTSAPSTTGRAIKRGRDAALAGAQRAAPARRR